MRTTIHTDLAAGRVVSGPLRSSPRHGVQGAFRLALNGQTLTVIASNGRDWIEYGLPSPAWEHVLVSTPVRTPTWEEMDYVRQLFWPDEETPVQFHVGGSAKKNLHEHCLHLWRPIGVKIPLPPRETV